MALIVAMVAAIFVVVSAGEGLTQIVLPQGFGMAGGQTVPKPGFDLALTALAAGDFTSALEIASREHQGGIRAGTQRWIDSIATAAVVGECHYELGSLREAVAAYDEALLISAAHADWLLAVQFPPQGPRPLAQQRVATWGRSQRNTSPAGIPGTISIRLGGADPQEVLQKGGVLAAPVNYPVRPQEIMRSLVIAIYRRGVILGELAREGAAIDEATKALLRRPAPPNHYSQSWVDIALGAALWSQGKADQAQPLLLRGLLIGNQFDHSLSSWGLIVLGRIALDGDQPAAAARYFEEATYTAADYGDARALEEAFRLAATAHLAMGTRGVPPSIRGGADWSRTTLPLLRATLLGFEAEALAVAGDAQAAAGVLAEMDGRLMRGDPGRGLVGMQRAYAAALTAYDAGDVAVGDRELEQAVAIARRRTPLLFQASRLVEMLMAGFGGISDRQADLLFSKLLGDPSPRETSLDPLGSLARLCAPRTEAFEAWLAAATRRGSDATLTAAEAAARSRWLVSQPLGGRRIAVECLLGSDPDRLPRGDAARRAAVLARHPDLAVVLDTLTRVRTPLTASLLAAAGEPPHDQDDAPERPQTPGDPVAWRDFKSLSERCRQGVAKIAAGRDAPPLDMPPLTPAPEIRRRLAPRQLLLSFHWSSGGLLAALESHDRVATWQVRQPAAVAKEMASLARALCLFDPIAPVTTERLQESDWQTPIARIERLLFENSKVVLAEGIDELVIVPDGMLWYLPFELLPVGSARPVAGGPRPPGARAEPTESLASPQLADQQPPADTNRLSDVCRIRYAPTRSLAVLRFETPQTGGPVGIYAGRLFRGDKPVVAQELAARLTGSLDRAVALPAPTPAAPMPLVASLLDTLVVFDELSGDGPVSTRPLLSMQGGKPAMTFGDWLSPPSKRPRCIILPGFQSAMAGGLSKLPTRPGEDIFLAVTDLVAAGGRTALVSRWRMGGKTSGDLVEEFLRDREPGDGEAEVPPAAESWQRAVATATAEQPDVGREPRLKQSPAAVLPDSRHPFLWAGYLLIDCGGGRYTDPPPNGPIQPAKPVMQPAPPNQQPAPPNQQPAPPNQQPAPPNQQPAPPAGVPVPAAGPAAGRPPQPQGPLNPAMPRGK
jgi:tetratricopeptide (TPR) repeat protein